MNLINKIFRRKNPCNKCIDLFKNTKDNTYVGKISLLNLVNKKGFNLVDYAERKPLIIDPNSSLMSVIKKLSNFVGESIPIVNKKTNAMIGIISENDVLKAYLEISKEINQIEKH